MGTTPAGCPLVPRSAAASFPPSPSPSARRVSSPRPAGAIARRPRTACAERAARRRPRHDACDLWEVMAAFSIIQDVPRLLRLGRTFYPPQRSDHSTGAPIAAGRVCRAEHISARLRSLAMTCGARVTAFRFACHRDATAFSRLGAVETFSGRSSAALIAQSALIERTCRVRNAERLGSSASSRD